MQAFVAKAVRGKSLYNPWTCKYILCLNKSLKFQSYLSKAMKTVIDWFRYLMPSLNSKKKQGHIHVNNLSVSIKCNLCRQAAAWATVLPLSDSGKALSVSTCCYSSETQRLNGITFYILLHVIVQRFHPVPINASLIASLLNKFSVPKHSISWPLWLRSHDFAPPLLCRWKGSTEIALKADLDNSTV